MFKVAPDAPYFCYSVMKSKLVLKSRQCTETRSSPQRTCMANSQSRESSTSVTQEVPHTASQGAPHTTGKAATLRCLFSRRGTHTGEDAEVQGALRAVEVAVAVETDGGCRELMTT